MSESLACPVPIFPLEKKRGGGGVEKGEGVGMHSPKATAKPTAQTSPMPILLLYRLACSHDAAPVQAPKVWI